MPHDLLRPWGQPDDRQVPMHLPRRLPCQALAYTAHRGHPGLRTGSELRLDLRAHFVTDDGAHGRCGSVRALGEKLQAAAVAVASIERMFIEEDVLWVVLSMEVPAVTC